MEFKKIIIFGFPHCGTTILRSIIGHTDTVDVIDSAELAEIPSPYNTEKEFVLIKYPFTKQEFFNSRYDDFFKIFIIRNPMFVFSSLNKRFSSRLTHPHTISEYIKTIKKFNYYKKNPMKNLFTIRYEDIFKDNFCCIRQLLDSIGIVYTDDIFNNTKFNNKIGKSPIPTSTPSHNNHVLYRSWQINQPFSLRNNKDEICITDKQKQLIVDSSDITSTYPSIVDSC